MLDAEDTRSIIAGVFDLRVKVTEIAVDVRAIRRELLNRDLEYALALADEADLLTMRHYRALDLRVETKADLTPVTEADQAVESALRARIARDRGEAVAGEEYGVADADVRWWLDPIDGTKQYARG